MKWTGINRAVLPLCYALSAAVVAACSSEADDEIAGPRNGVLGGPDVDGGVVGPGGGTSYPPLPPYVVDTSPLPADYGIYDHAKECFDRFQVEVPSTFDCDGPDSSRLKIEVDGAEVTSGIPAQCDKPSLVGNKYACVPGARVTKWEQVNKYGHKIATVVVCRRSKASALESGAFDNIAVLQSDLQNNETCWYQIRQDTSFIGRKIPAPYSPGRAKGDATDRRAAAIYESPVTLTSDDSECFRCHDSSVWLRTPWIGVKNQVPSASGKVNEIPRTEGEPTFIGRAFRSWNLASNRPTQIRIDAAKLDQAYPPSASERAAIQSGAMAPSNACTQCHAIAKSSLANTAQGTCNHFARYFMTEQPSWYQSTVSGSKVSAHGNAFPLTAWMPPGADTMFQTESAYRAYYARAFDAITVCCDDPSVPGCTK